MSETRETYILKEQFETLYGPIDTPQLVTRYYEFVARRQGRTDALVQAIVKRVKNNERSIVIVHRMAFSNDIIRRVCEEFRDTKTVAEVRRLIKFVTYKRDYRWEDELRGYQDPIFVDHVVLEMRAAEFVDYINAMYGPRTAIKSLDELYNEEFGELSEKVWNVKPLDIEE